MRPAHVIEIVTPKKFVLNGLWFGPKKPARTIIVIHGMFSSAFSLQHIVKKLVDAQTAVVTFNNRGFETVADVRQRIGKKRKHHQAGTAHEVFTDCVDDIQGAINFTKKAGVKDIYLAGHSTGCQKSIYWASKPGDKGVRGIILLAPLSDYAGGRNKPNLKSVLNIAKKMLKSGKKHQLLPPNSWWHDVDAQRFHSLYTPNSTEEIFCYSQPNKKPKIYQSIKMPVITFFAGDDEYSERPAARLAEWFKKNSGSNRFAAHIIPNVGHSFRGGEARIAKGIQKWI